MSKGNRLSVLFNKNMIILYLILLAAFLVRIIGLDWNLPHSMFAPYELDEYSTVKIALQVLRDRNFSPGSFLWPSLYFYIQAFAYGNYCFWALLMGFLQSLNDLTIREVYLVGRMTTVLFGVANILLVYLIGKRMYSKKVGLIASLFLSFSLLHVKYSRLIRPDIPMAFFITLSFFFIYLIYERGKTKDYLLATLFAGFSIATKYTGVFLIVPIFLAHLFYGLKEKKKLFSIFFDKKVLLVIIFIAVGFFIAFPYALVRYRYLFVTIGNWLRGLNKITANQPGEINSWVYYITYSLNHSLGYALAIFSLIGIIYGIFTHRKKDILLLSFPLLYYFIMGSFSRHGDRYFLPIVPFLTIIAAMFLVKVISRISFSQSKRNLTLAIIAFILIFLPGVEVVRYAKLMTEKGTRIEAKDWVKENIPPGKRIAYEYYFPHFSGYKMENMYVVGSHPFDWYKNKFDYIIINSGRYGRYFQTSLKQYQGIRRNYEEIETMCELVKQFDPSPSSPTNPNPVVKIYRIKYEYP
jgi:4-amino-4-deoxy-L-arabinose transferase-like glycosyltransferase